MSKFVCPNACGATFVTTAHVMQDWEVTADGDYVSTIQDCLEVTHKPNDGNIWTCKKCGAEAIISTQIQERIDDRERYDPKTQIMVIWDIHDVKGLSGYGGLTDKQAMDVLMSAKRCHDASVGINWDTLEAAAEMLYGKLRYKDRKGA